MTVSTTIAKSGPYAGAGTAGPFTVGFRFLQNDHLRVVRTSPDGVDTTLSLTTDYSVFGAGNTTGSVLLTGALPVGWKLTILRAVPATQETDYVQNDAFPAESHERALDKLTMIVQQQQETLTRTLRAPESDTAPSLFIPSAEQRANKYLGFDENGVPITTTLDIGDVEEAVAEAEAAAAAAAISEDNAANSATASAASAQLAQDQADLVTDQIAAVTPSVAMLSGDGGTSFTLPKSPGSENNTMVFVSGVYQNKDTYSIAGDVITFTEAPPVGTENIEVVIAPSVMLSVGLAQDVSFQQSGSGAIARSMLDKGRETISVKDFVVFGNGVNDDTNGINDAIAEAIAKGADLLWPDGDYLCTGNLNLFWDVTHYGNGRVIKPTGEIYHITPKQKIFTADENWIYASASGLTTADGLSPANPVVLSRAFDRLKTIGSKAQSGIWGIRMLGNFSGGGLTIADLPAFKNRFRLWGDQDPVTGAPATTWSYPGSGATIAIRMDSINSPTLYLHFKGIHFTGWTGRTVTIWSTNLTFMEYCAFTDCNGGLNNRYGYASVRNNTFTRCTLAVGIGYQGSGNIGTVSPATGQLSPLGNTFIDCVTGVDIGRSSICYIQGNLFENGGINISGTRLSRFATGGNTHVNWTGSSAIRSSSMSLFTPADGGAVIDTFIHSDDAAMPYLQFGNSANEDINSISPETLHQTSRGSYSIVNQSGVRTNLTSTAPVGSNWTPFRLPRYALKNPNVKLRAVMHLAVDAGAGGTLTLHSINFNATAYLISFEIPIKASSVSGIIELEFMRPGRFATGTVDAGGEYWCKAMWTDGTCTVQRGTVTNVLGANYSAMDESQAAYRWYFTPASNVTMTFANMRTYVEY